MPALRPPINWWTFAESGSAQRHHSLDPLRNQLHLALHIALEIAVLAPFLHGADGAHAAIALVGTALVEDGVAGRLFGPGKQGADHDDVGAGSNCFGKITGDI